MKLQAAFREAWRNIATGSVRARRTALAATLAVCVLAGADMAATRQLVDQADEFVSRGAAVTMVVAAGRVDGARCDRLVESFGVSAAGALRSSSRQLVPTVLPSAPIPVYEVSAAFPAIVRAVPRTAGVLLGPEASGALGVESAGVLTTTAGVMRVGGGFAYPDDGRRPGLAYAALAPTASDLPFDECWVESWPAIDLTGALLGTIRLSDGADDPPSIAQLNPTLGETFDGGIRFSERITRFGALAAALIGIGLGFTGIRARRLALASALHAGAAAADLRRIVGMETLAWVALSVVLVMPVLTLMESVVTSGADTSLAVLTVPAALYAGGFAGALTGLTTIRERYLFRYFKLR